MERPSSSARFDAHSTPVDETPTSDPCPPPKSGSTVVADTGSRRNLGGGVC